MKAKMMEYGQRQVVFDFLPIIGEGRRTVESIMRFNAERHGRHGKFVAGSGSLHPLGYQEWQRFYSPLSAKGAQ